MATVKITNDNFADTIEKGGLVLLDWWAPWCGPCRAFGPVYERVAATNPDAVFGKINTEEEHELAELFEIRSIPTLMVIRDKVLLFSQPGMLSEKALVELLGKLRAVDVEAIRRENEKNESNAKTAVA
jgi:thioredoxin 1